MQTLRQLFKAGRGPSSSHTMGPARAATLFMQANPFAASFEVTLYGSLAKTGKGHQTDVALKEAFAPRPVTVLFDVTSETPHPNTMDFRALLKGEVVDTMRAVSVGGGAIEVDGQAGAALPDIYPHTSYSELSAFCKERGHRLWQYVEQTEGPSVWDYLAEMWGVMCSAIEAGLSAEGELPGGLRTKRRAAGLVFGRAEESAQTRENRMICAYAFAASEHNASGGLIVTAPTCGASGVVPAVLRFCQEEHRFSDREVLRALAVGGLIGNLIKKNASISGAECGCQAEVGTACAMAAAALGELFQMDLDQIECAAEVAMEHHLGLTCDPVLGLVQIPCIERNAVAAMRAVNAQRLAEFLAHTRKISLDTVIRTMYQTGLDMHAKYKETAEGGLAINYVIADDD